MARRVAYINQELANTPEAKLIHLDPGGFAGYSPQGGNIKTARIMEMYQQIGLDAVNVSGRDFLNDADSFMELTQKYDLPLISSNIIYEGSDEAVFPRYITLNVDGKAMHVIGLTRKLPNRWKLGNGKVIAIADPVESLKASLKELEGKPGSIILLTHYPNRELEGLLKEVEGIDVVVAADARSYSQNNDTIAGIPVSYAGRQGRALGLLQGELTTDSLKVTNHQMIILLLKLPEDPAIKAKVDALLAEDSQ